MCRVVLFPKYTSSNVVLSCCLAGRITRPCVGMLGVCREECCCNLWMIYVFVSVEIFLSVYWLSCLYLTVYSLIDLTSHAMVTSKRSLRNLIA